MALRLSRVNPEQLGLLSDISRRTFRDAFEDQNSRADFEDYMANAFSEAKLSEEIENSGSTFYLAYQENELAGYLKLNSGEAQTDIRDTESLELERIYVLRDFQGQRIGQWMLQQAVEIAVRAQKSYLWLGVWEENKAAIRFYQRHGFLKFGEHPYYIGEDRQTDWLMRLDLVTFGAKS